eukprot:341981-Pyramimonas_sp.AAC.1
MQLDVEPDALRTSVADAPPTSPMQRQCIGDTSTTRQDPPTPPTRTPFGRPLAQCARMQLGVRCCRVREFVIARGLDGSGVTRLLPQVLETPAASRRLR